MSELGKYSKTLIHNCSHRLLKKCNQTVFVDDNSVYEIFVLWLLFFILDGGSNFLEFSFTEDCLLVFTYD